jgi:hypothetical protein
LYTLPPYIKTYIYFYFEKMQSVSLTILYYNFGSELLKFPFISRFRVGLETQLIIDYSVLRDLETPRDLDTLIGKLLQILTDLYCIFYMKSNRYHLSSVQFLLSLSLWPLRMILEEVQF